MKGRIGKLLIVGVASMAATLASAQQFQFGTFSAGTFDLNTLIDTETVDFYYYNGHAAIPVDTFYLDGNTDTGYLSGNSGADKLSFQFTIDNSQGLGTAVNQEMSWQTTGATGQFAGLSGLGSFSIDFSYFNDHQADTATGLTGELTAVPEPASFAALGLGALMLIRRRKKA